METLKLICILSGLLASPAQAEESVIDLGTLQVEGEVRQPEVQFYQAKKVPDKVVKKAAEALFENFEKELLKKKPKKRGQQK